MKDVLIWGALLVVLGFGAMLSTKIPALGFAEVGFCGRCHAMDVQASTYLDSVHAQEAHCGDCHDPHGLVTGSAYAAFTGTRDVYRVVTNTTPEVIKATNMSKNVLQGNCVRCHADVLGFIGDTMQNSGRYCFECHKKIVHDK